MDDEPNHDAEEEYAADYKRNTPVFFTYTALRKERSGFRRLSTGAAAFQSACRFGLVKWISVRARVGRLVRRRRLPVWKMSMRIQDKCRCKPARTLQFQQSLRTL